MKKIFVLIAIVMCSSGVVAQTGYDDTTTVEKVIVNKDPRLDILAKVQYDFNHAAKRFGKGYRLFILKTNNRDYAMQVRSYLLQNYPEEKVIMSYQSPFIKLKFGDFEDRSDAERYRDMILKGGVVTGNVYIVPETIELKPDKTEQEEKQ